MALWDGLLGRRNGHAPGVGADDRGRLQRQLAEAQDNLELLQEQMGDLRTELAFDDLGWRPLGPYTTWQLGREALREARVRSRSMYLRNPLIHYAVDLQAIYVFGQGVSFVAVDAGVQAVLDAFLEDPANQTELTSHEARLMKERELQLDGDLFFVLFTDRAGAVRIRTLPVHEITEIVTNPEDAKEPWYYRRDWTQQTTNLESGLPQLQVRTVYYPDWRYQPTGARPQLIGQKPVEWETPVYHRKVGGFSDMPFGVPETFAAQDWVLAHKRNLEDWASIVEAHRKFAWAVKQPGGARGVQALRGKLGTTFGGGPGPGAETNPPPGTASTAIMTPSFDLQPVRTAGATASPEDSRQLRLMVSAGTATPDHFFDADVGNYATAKTLDRPTELKFRNRQTLWGDTFGDLFQYVVDRYLEAHDGRLAARPPAGDQVQATTAAPLDRTIDVQFPPILERDVGAVVTAVVEAITLAGHPPYSDTLLQQLMPYILNALGEDDVDAKLAALFPETEPAPEDQASTTGTPGPYSPLDPAAVVPSGAAF